MQKRTIVTREEWLAQRRALLVEEKELTRQRDALAAKRRQLPWVRLEKDYMFESEFGLVNLGALFGPHSQLIVYHFMFGTDWKTGCKSCSFWADTYNGLTPHLNARDIAFAAISLAPMDKIAPFKERMGWQFNWVSSHPDTFNQDFHVSFGKDHSPEVPVDHNFDPAYLFPVAEAPGVSVFVKDEDEVVYHTYSAYARGIDHLNAAYSYIDLTPKGRDEPTDRNTMFWVRHHDRYESV